MPPTSASRSTACNQGEEWRSEEGRLSTVATEPVSGARKHRSEQGGANE